MSNPKLLDIEKWFQAWEYGIDGKSSESLRDGHNARTTLVDRFMRNKIEKQYTKNAIKEIMIKDWLVHREQKAEPINIRLVVKALERLTT